MTSPAIGAIAAACSLAAACAEAMAQVNRLEATRLERSPGSVKWV